MSACSYLSRKFTTELFITLLISLCILGSFTGGKWNLYCELNIDKIRKRNKCLLSLRAPNWPCEHEHQPTQVGLVIPTLHSVTAYRDHFKTVWIA